MMIPIHIGKTRKERQKIIWSIQLQASRNFFSSSWLALIVFINHQPANLRMNELFYFILFSRWESILRKKWRSPILPLLLPVISMFSMVGFHRSPVDGEYWLIRWYGAHVEHTFCYGWWIIQTPHNFSLVHELSRPENLCVVAWMGLKAEMNVKWMLRSSTVVLEGDGKDYTELPATMPGLRTGNLRTLPDIIKMDVRAQSGHVPNYGRWG